MTKTSFKIGLLGLGMMGKQHMESSRALPGVEMVTRDSPGFDQLPPQATSELTQTALCQAMIEDPTIDAIDICLPTGMHAPLTIAALNAGKHVLCEKPMALTTEDCARMLEASDRAWKRHQGVLMIAHVLRFWPAYLYLREAVACRSYGDIQSLALGRKSGLPVWAPWLLRAEESGGGILDMLVHDFDQALLLFGAPTSVVVRSPASHNMVDCSLKYPNGFEIAVDGGWYEGEVPFSMHFELASRAGELRYTAGQLQLAHPAGPVEPIVQAKSDAYAVQLAYFVDCCQKGHRPLECTPESSAQAVALALKVAAMAAKGDGVEHPL
jgi:predicted dehydrogenase